MAIALSPATIVIALVIKIRDGGRVLYPAPRVGLQGEKFTMYKFRTMVPKADQLGGDSTLLPTPG